MLAAGVNRDVCLLAGFAVEAVLRVAVREDEVLRTGCDRDAHPVARQEGVRALRGADRDLIDLARLHIFRIKITAMFQRKASPPCPRPCGPDGPHPDLIKAAGPPGGFPDIIIAVDFNAF